MCLIILWYHWDFDMFGFLKILPWSHVFDCLNIIYSSEYDTSWAYFFQMPDLKNVLQKIMCLSTSRLISFQWLKYNKLPAFVKTVTLFKKDHFNTLEIKCPTLLMKSQWSQGYLECLNSGSSEERSWVTVMLKCFQWLCSKIYSLYKGLLWENEAPIF